MLRPRRPNPMHAPPSPLHYDKLPLPPKWWIHHGSVQDPAMARPGTSDPALLLLSTMAGSLSVPRCGSSACSSFSGRRWPTPPLPPPGCDRRGRMRPNLVEMWWCEAKARWPLLRQRCGGQIDPVIGDTHMADRATSILAHIGRDPLPWRWNKAQVQAC